MALIVPDFQLLEPTRFITDRSYGTADPRQQIELQGPGERLMPEEFWRTIWCCWQLDLRIVRLTGITEWAEPLCSESVVAAAAAASLGARPGFFMHISQREKFRIGPLYAEDRAGPHWLRHRERANDSGCLQFFDSTVAVRYVPNDQESVTLWQHDNLCGWPLRLQETPVSPVRPRRGAYFNLMYGRRIALLREAPRKKCERIINALGLPLVDCASAGASEIVSIPWEPIQTQVTATERRALGRLLQFRKPDAIVNLTNGIQTQESGNHDESE